MKGQRHVRTYAISPLKGRIGVSKHAAQAQNRQAFPPSHAQGAVGQTPSPHTISNCILVNMKCASTKLITLKRKLKRDLAQSSWEREGCDDFLSFLNSFGTRTTAFPFPLGFSKKPINQKNKASETGRKQARKGGGRRRKGEGKEKKED